MLRGLFRAGDRHEFVRRVRFGGRVYQPGDRVPELPKHVRLYLWRSGSIGRAGSRWVAQQVARQRKRAALANLRSAQERVERAGALVTAAGQATDGLREEIDAVRHDIDEREAALDAAVAELDSAREEYVSASNAALEYGVVAPVAQVLSELPEIGSGEGDGNGEDPSDGIIALGGGWYSVVLPNGEAERVRGREQAEQRLAEAWASAPVAPDGQPEVPVSAPADATVGAERSARGEEPPNGQ